MNVKIRLMERLETWATTFSADPGLAVIPQLYYQLVKNNTPRSVRLVIFLVRMRDSPVVVKANVKRFDVQ